MDKLQPAEDKIIHSIETEIMNKFSLPQKPKTFGEEYLFPEDTSNITSVELGNWLFKLASWKGYALRLIAIAEMEKSVLEDIFNTSLARRIGELDRGDRSTKELALGKIIGKDGEMRKKKAKLIEKDAEVTSLRRLVEIYSFQFDAISREITRRNSENRIMQGGGNYG